MKKFLLLSLATLISASLAFAQDRTISGKVTSAEDGSGIPGVNVVVKGTTTGAVTDVDGNYKFSVSTEGGFLLFSFIGLETQEIEIGSRSVIDISMASDVQQLSEIVVTGYGIEREKKEITVQTSEIDASELIVGQQTRAANALAGKVAGLQINVQNNGVNPSSQILLRGLRSISSSNAALIVMDGVIVSQGAFDQLNPNDIESISILKGASAAATYGSLGANGALMVTTKAGSLGSKFTIGINSTTTWEQVAYMPDLQTEHGTGWDGAYDNIENTNWGPRFDGQVRQIGPELDFDLYGIGTQMVPYAPVANNLRDFYETGTTYQNTVYITGGDETGKYYMSIGNQNTTGVVPSDKYTRNTYRINASKKLGSVNLSVNASYFTDDRDIVGDQIGDQDRTLYWFVLNTPANIPLSTYKDWDNPQSYGYADNYYNAYYQNPYWAVGTNRDLDQTSRMNSSFSVGWEINDNISWTTRAGVNTTSGAGKNWRARQEYDPVRQPFHSNVSSFVEDTGYKSEIFNGNSIFAFDYNLMPDLTLKALVGGTFYTTKYKSSFIRANNLSIPDFYDISNGTGQLEGTVDQSERRTIGAFADLTFGFRDYLFLNATGRYDKTSTLPEGKNGYFYPSVGVSFVATEAIGALQNNRILSYAKLTVSNATAYNDLNPYQINERYSQSGGFPFGAINGFALSNQTVDASIEKEKLNTTEFGLNLGFLDSRFTLDAAYFITKTTNLITSTTPSFASGASTFLTNIGELKGQGLELTLGANVLNIGDFDWDLFVNYTMNETKVVSIKDDLKEVAITTNGKRGVYAIVGQPFPMIKAASYTRDTQGRIVVDAVSGNPLVGAVEQMGKTTPDYILGGTSSMKWKGISLTATVDYRTGHVYFAQMADAMEFTGRGAESVASGRKDFVWPNSVIKQSDGSYVANTNTPTSGAVMGLWQNTYNEIKENYVRDASAFKIREIALNYVLPLSITEKTKVFSRIAVGFVAVNPFTWLPEENRYSDPEFNNGGSTTNAIGIGGYFQSPPTKSYGFNLNLEF
jgi:TonB-linked SusC/RagA family outer membrane protein